MDIKFSRLLSEISNFKVITIVMERGVLIVLVEYNEIQHITRQNM